MACIRRFLAVVAFLALASLSVMVCPVAGDCYTPDGEPYGYHQGCVLPTEGMMTSCCATLDLCLDNLLCAHMDNNGNETYYRGTCSNSPNWTLPNCPNFCKGHTVEDSHDGEWPVGKCPSDGKSADRWFCIGNETGYGTVDNCTDPSFGFTLSGEEIPFVFLTASQLTCHRRHPGVLDLRDPTVVLGSGPGNANCSRHFHCLLLERHGDRVFLGIDFGFRGLAAADLSSDQLALV